MTYFYKARKNHEIERIAEQVLSKSPNRRHSPSVDIEGIAEDLGIDILPRVGFRHIASGYVARDARLIVIDESEYSYLPRARFTIAEEVCHRILEFNLWSGEGIPVGARCDELSEKQHFYVEKDATSLASAILMPLDEFKVFFRSHARDFIAASVPENVLVRQVLEALAKAFEVSPKAAFYRARSLKLIDKEGQMD